jgi:hypothetical protein
MGPSAALYRPLNPPTTGSILAAPAGEQPWSYFTTDKQKYFCCYVTVDFAMAASQKGFGTFKLFRQKKTNIIQKMTNNIRLSLPSSFII